MVEVAEVATAFAQWFADHRSGENHGREPTVTCTHTVRLAGLVGCRTTALWRRRACHLRAD